ncbi:hypothetical protein V2H45_16895 [Tumidithrix elongata RA019]|uniref:Transposase n=1 Tax=Tumidithrix elongata BACA0141 TaxID=2716417 RepID=A0AAW9Q4P9_9CYAN|nr:hypothetical protein [Tumidithrix elongata RA019]
MTEPLRFRDIGQTIYDFGHSFWVHCPQCDRLSTVMPFSESASEAAPLPQTQTHKIFDRHRLSCKYCGYSKDWQGNSVTIGGDRDWYFNLTLWLQIPCCGEILWAYNAEHLDFLENFVRAKLRERSPDPKLGWQNQSLASRLPNWLQSAKNRQQILHGIAKLREKLPDTSN